MPGSAVSQLAPQIGACVQWSGETHHCYIVSEPQPPPGVLAHKRCFLTFLLRPQRATSMAHVARDAHVVGCSAWRRRDRRLRAFWRHEQQAVRMAVAAATHHSYHRSSAHACTQTDLVYVTPAPVIVTFVVPSQQLPPVYTTTTVTADDNLDLISLVYPQFSCSGAFCASCRWFSSSC